MMIQSLAALAMVLGLFAALVWLMRRLQRRCPQSQTGGLRIVQRLSLDSRHHLVEVAHGGHLYLIGLYPDGMTTIARKTDTESNVCRAMPETR